MRRLDEAQVEAQLREWDARLQRGEPVCFSVSRLKAAAAVVATAAFAAAGVWIMLSDDGWVNRLLGAACVLLFLVAGVAALGTLVRARDAVRVDVSGITVPWFSVGWSEVAGASFHRLRRNNSVRLLLLPRAAERYGRSVSQWRQAWEALGGSDASSMPLPPWLATDARLVARWLDERSG